MRSLGTPKNRTSQYWQAPMDKTRIIPSPSAGRKPWHGGYPGKLPRVMTAAEWRHAVRSTYAFFGPRERSDLAGPC